MKSSLPISSSTSGEKIPCRAPQKIPSRPRQPNRQPPNASAAHYLRAAVRHHLKPRERNRQKVPAGHRLHAFPCVENATDNTHITSIGLKADIALRPMRFHAHRQRFFRTTNSHTKKKKPYFGTFLLQGSLYRQKTTVRKPQKNKGLKHCRKYV